MRDGEREKGKERRDYLNVIRHQTRPGTPERMSGLGKEDDKK